MKQNIRIAKELVRIAKSLVANNNSILNDDKIIEYKNYLKEFARKNNYKIEDNNNECKLIKQEKFENRIYDITVVVLFKDNEYYVVVKPQGGGSIHSRKYGDFIPQRLQQFKEDLQINIELCFGDSADSFQFQSWTNVSDPYI